MTKFATRFLSNESGTTAIEYALIASGIALAIIVTVNALGGSLTTAYTAIANAL